MESRSHTRLLIKANRGSQPPGMDMLSVIMTSCRLWPVEKTFPALLQFADRSLARAQGTAATRHPLRLARFLPLSRMSLATNWGARALLAIAAFLVLQQFVSHLPFGRRLVLEKELPADEGVTSAPESDQQWLGVQGTAAFPAASGGCRSPRS